MLETVKSARSSNRSKADLSKPVMSDTSRGVAQSRLVMSLDMVLAVPPESSIATLIPRPDSLAIYAPPVLVVVPVIHPLQRLHDPLVFR
jgi:hypothetical protein